MLKTLTVCCLILGLTTASILLTAVQNLANASVVPYDGNLRPELERTFQNLNETYSIDQNEALVWARSLYGQSLGSSDDVRAWALMSYCAILLENDSITKAQGLQSDTSSINWRNVSPWIKAFRSLNVGLSLSFEGKYSEADRFFKDALDQDQNGNLTIHILTSLADNLRYQGKLDQSLIKWYEALKLSESMADSAEIADCYMGRGIVRFLQTDLERAESDILIFQNYYSRISNQKKKALGLSILGLVRYQNREYEKSIELNLKAFEIRKMIGDLKGQGESLNNLSLGHMGLKNWSQALRYLEEAVQLKIKANDLTQMTVIFNNMGHCYQRLGNDSEALRYFRLALEKGQQNGQIGDVLNSFRNIMRVYRANRDFESAFEIQSQLLAFKDSLAEAERNEALAELEVKYETSRKESEITLLQREGTIITNRWLTLALGLFLTIVIGILFIDNQKRKHRQEKQLLIAEDELQKAEIKIMSDLLEYNQNKLSLYTESILRKNELVGQLETKLKTAAADAGVDIGPSEKLIEDFSSVRILTDDDWKEFKALFDGVHPGLLDRLLSEYADLTLGEQRLFLLMKLNLSTKEIANILGVSPDSIKKGRYRLKKKIGMDESISIQDFVSSF